MMSMLGQKSDHAMQRATAAGMAYYQYAARLIAERREAPSDDLMSILVNAEVDGDQACMMTTSSRSRC